MKIAILTSGFLPVIDGVTVSGLYRVQKLSQWQHEVLLFCPDYSSLKAMYPNWQDYTGNILPGVRVVNLASTPFMGIDFERNVSRSSYEIVLQELDKFKPDIIHVDEPERMFVGFLRLPGIDFAKRRGIPCIGFYRTNFLEYLEDYFPLPPIGMTVLKFLFKKFIAWVYNAYDLTLIHSLITQQKLIEIGIKNLKFAHLSGFDVDQYNSALRVNNFFEKNYSLPQVDCQIKLVFLGRLTPDKGWGFTIKAFAQVAQVVDLKNIALLIAGDGQMRDEIATQLGKLTPNVHLLGRITPDKIPELLVNSDIYVTNSEKEARGLTILEAFAAGLPLIAPRAGGIPQNVRDGINGFLYTPQDLDDFMNKLKILLENPKLRQEMGNKGKQDIESYTWDNAVKNLVRIWEEQIAKKQKSNLTPP